MSAKANEGTVSGHIDLVDNRPDGSTLSIPVVARVGK